MKRFALLALLLTWEGALAQVPGITYRCVDDTGRSVYTNVKEEMSDRRCTIVSREVSVVPVTRLWTKPNSTEQGFSMDRGQCQAQGLSVTGMQSDQVAAVFDACMAGKGWTLQQPKAKPTGVKP